MVSLKSSDAELIAFARKEMTARPQGNSFQRRVDTPFRTHLPTAAVVNSDWSSEKILLEQISKIYFTEGHLKDAALAIQELAASHDLKSLLQQTAERSAFVITQLEKVWTPAPATLLGQGDWAVRAGRLILHEMWPSEVRDQWIGLFEYEAAANQANAYRLALLWARQLELERFSSPLSAGVKATAESSEQLLRWIRANVHI